MRGWTAYLAIESAAGPGQSSRMPMPKPAELGPRVYRKGRWWQVDLRPWRYGRPTMRNPKHPGWPDTGERTELQDVAE